MNKSVPIGEVYIFYSKLKPKEEKNIKPLGSMTTPAETKPKEIYTKEEIKRLSIEDLKDPVIRNNVYKSLAMEK
jgi:hypothetical protein